MFKQYQVPRTRWSICTLTTLEDWYLPLVKSKEVQWSKSPCFLWYRQLKVTGRIIYCYFIFLISKWWKLFFDWKPLSLQIRMSATCLTRGHSYIWPNFRMLIYALILMRQLTSWTLQFGGFNFFSTVPNTAYSLHNGNNRSNPCIKMRIADISGYASSNLQDLLVSLTPLITLIARLQVVDQASETYRQRQKRTGICRHTFTDKRADKSEIHARCFWSSLQTCRCLLNNSDEVCRPAGSVFSFRTFSQKFTVKSALLQGYKSKQKTASTRRNASGVLQRAWQVFVCIYCKNLWLPECSTINTRNAMTSYNGHTTTYANLSCLVVIND